MQAHDYGSASYWDERYAADETQYDWYQDYSTLRPYIEPFLRNHNDFEILYAGCGNSSLGASIYDAGFPNITNIDISTVVIAQMSQVYANREEMEFTVMDARKMEYVPDQCFDLIVDKALFDAIVCSESNLRDVDQLLKEMYRILKTGGHYLIISHAPPERRMNYFEKVLPSGIEVQTYAIRKQPLQGFNENNGQEFHYMYVLKKLQA